MIRVVVSLLLVVVALSGCGWETLSATGAVVGVDQASLTDVRSFTLRTQTGETVMFRIGTLDLSEGGFPANHLREHMATVTPVLVEYIEEGTEHVAVRLTDAP